MTERVTHSPTLLRRVEAAEEDAKYWRGKANHVSARLVAAEAERDAARESERIMQEDRDYTQGQLEAAEAELSVYRERGAENAEELIEARGRIANALLMCDRDPAHHYLWAIARALTEGTGQ